MFLGSKFLLLKLFQQCQHIEEDQTLRQKESIEAKQNFNDLAKVLILKKKKLNTGDTESIGAWE